MIGSGPRTARAKVELGCVLLLKGKVLDIKAESAFANSLKIPIVSL
jgi:hypothetical protein